MTEKLGPLSNSCMITLWIFFHTQLDSTYGGKDGSDIELNRGAGSF